MTAYYNEHDPFAAAWLRQLIQYGHIADGIVDERSIEDVTPADLDGFTQCHFFAGIGVWSYALRSAGWSDDTPVWTGSCPCQPFSAAGKGAGFDDERHLWPAFHWLVQECRPAVVLGEQVASKDADVWIDLVQTDMEILDYAFGAIPFPVASVGGPHIRDRDYWLAVTNGTRPFPAAHGRLYSGQDGTRSWNGEPVRPRDVGGMVHTVGTGLEGQRSGYPSESGRDGTFRPAAETGEPGRVADANNHQPWSRGNGGSSIGEGFRLESSGRSDVGGMADATGTGRKMAILAGSIRDASSGIRQTDGPGSDGASVGTSPVNGFWRDSDWLHCRDGRWRPVEPGTFPLAHGPAARVGRLRGYGNAIAAPQAQAFIETVMDIIG